jgi:hypothetical protein
MRHWMLVGLIAFAAATVSAGAARAQTDYDCSDFQYQEDAQAQLLPGDPYGLDADHDGIACENLPPRPIATAPGVYGPCDPSVPPALTFSGIPSQPAIGRTYQLTLTDIITDQGFYDGLGIQLVARTEDGVLWTGSLDSNVETSIRLTDEQPVTLAATYDEYLFATKTRCKALIERTLLGHVPPLPTLGVAETKYHIRVALNRRFGAAYRDGYAKKVTGCSRRSRTRVRCEHVSWVVGDVSFAGKATIWLTREDGEPFWNYAYTIKRTNEYCASTGGRHCTRTYRVV